MIILTSSSKKAEKVLSTELNLLFGNFEKIYLDEIEFFNQYNYLKNIFFPLLPSSFFFSFFIKILGNNSIYYHLIKDSIKRNYCKEKEEESIISIIEENFYDRETYFYQKFINKVDALLTHFKSLLPLKILGFISEGYIRKKELVSLSICDSKELANKLQKLCDLNYLENLGNLYRIKDSLFSFWLNYVFKFTSSFSTLEFEEKREIWRKRIKEFIAIFKEDFFKDKVKKILDLVSLFKDDVLKMGKEKLKLPSIDKRKLISLPNFHIIVGEGNEILFIGVKETIPEDEDIVEFVEKTRSIKTKKVRKIFISLEKMNLNSRLIAKNHKITIWDIDEVNRILSIYNRSVIPLD
jgi:hypothetical protein